MTKKALKQLKTDKNKALKYVCEQGIKMCYDENLREIAKQITLKICKVFIVEILNSTLSLIYLYDQNEQIPEFTKADGCANISERQENGKRVSAIGISIQALMQGSEYTTLIFLHEFAHILYKVEVEHGEEYHKHLDKLIERYNNATGSQIKNDYFGLPTSDYRA